MTHYFRLGLLALCMLAPLRLATAAPEVPARSETRPLDPRVVRVKIEGVVDLRLRQGSPAQLILSGDPRWIARVTAEQNGDTVVIGSDMKGMHLGRQGSVRTTMSVEQNGGSVTIGDLTALHLGRQSPVRAEMVLPNLREVNSESLGTTEITGFRGDELELALDGAGSMNVNVHYRLISASLGGVGSMKLAGVNSEGIVLDLQGAGFVSLAGRSKWIKAELGGLGGLDAQAFTADSVTLELSGLGNATVTAHQSVNLNLSGMGSVTVYGKPLSRKVSVDGLGKVSWK